LSKINCVLLQQIEGFSHYHNHKLFPFWSVSGLYTQLNFIIFLIGENIAGRTEKKKQLS